MAEIQPKPKASQQKKKGQKENMDEESMEQNAIRYLHECEFEKVRLKHLEENLEFHKGKSFPCTGPRCRAGVPGNHP